MDGADDRQAPLILLVDDDAQVLAQLAASLRAARFEVCTASPAADKGARRPELAIVDLQAAGLTTLALPFLMMSAGASEELVRQAAAQGAVGYLSKPLDRGQLLPAVITGLARAREIRALHEAETRLTAALLCGRETAMAVGVVMERFRVDREAAFGALRQHARSNRLRLVDVAGEVLKNAACVHGIGRRLRKNASQH